MSRSEQLTASPRKTMMRSTQRIPLEILKLITLQVNMHPWVVLPLQFCTMQWPVIRKQIPMMQILIQCVCIRGSGVLRIKILSMSFTDIHRTFTKMHTAVQI